METPVKYHSDNWLFLSLLPFSPFFEVTWPTFGSRFDEIRAWPLKRIPEMVNDHLFIPINSRYEDPKNGDNHIAAVLAATGDHVQTVTNAGKRSGPCDHCAGGKGPWKDCAIPTPDKLQEWKKALGTMCCANHMYNPKPPGYLERVAVEKKLREEKKAADVKAVVAELDKQRMENCNSKWNGTYPTAISVKKDLLRQAEAIVKDRGLPYNTMVHNYLVAFTDCRWGMWHFPTLKDWVGSPGYNDLARYDYEKWLRDGVANAVIEAQEVLQSTAPYSRHA